MIFNTNSIFEKFTNLRLPLGIEPKFKGYEPL